MPSISPGPAAPPLPDVESLAQLEAMPREELVRRLDTTLGRQTVLWTSFYREEIARRDAAARERRMVELTVQIRSLTVAVTAATIFALAISVLALIRG